MYGVVSADPQFEFLGRQSFATSPTEGVVLERFGSLEGARRWASDSHHRKVQRRGQKESSTPGTEAQGASSITNISIQIQLNPRDDTRPRRTFDGLHHHSFVCRSSALLTLEQRRTQHSVDLGSQ